MRACARRSVDWVAISRKLLRRDPEPLLEDDFRGVNFTVRQHARAASTCFAHSLTATQGNKFMSGLRNENSTSNAAHRGNHYKNLSQVELAYRNAVVETFEPHRQQQ